MSATMLSPRSVLITGCNRGIGLEFVKHFLKLEPPPAHVFATCRTPENAKELQDLASSNPTLTIVKLEVTDQTSIEAARDTVAAKLEGRGLNLLINNAAIARFQKFGEVTAEAMVEVYKVNCVAPLMITQTFIPLLKLAASADADKPMSCSRAAIINISTGVASISENSSGRSYDYRASKVLITTGNVTESFDASTYQTSLIRHLLNGRLKEFCDLMNEEWRETVEDTFAEKIQTEIKGLCSQNQFPVLSSKTEENLSSVSWNVLSSEFEKRAPVFWKFLVSAATNRKQMNRNTRKTEQSITPALVSAACKLVSLYNSHMNVIQRLNSLILLKGGAKKSVFRRLSVTNDCLGYMATLSMADDFSSSWANDLQQWSAAVQEDTQIEKQMYDKIEALQRESDIVGDDVLTAATIMFEQADAEVELERHKSTMHPGFYFVGDNVDMRTKVRQMTLTNQNKDQHMFQICAYKNRVSGNHLDDSKPKDNIETVQFKELVPGHLEQTQLIQEFAFIVATQITELLPCFAQFKVVLPKHIEHKNMKDTTKKSQRVNMGVLQKNEQFNEDMTDICTFIHKYVPGTSEDDDWQKKPVKILSGGDYLTFERHKQAQSAKRNGRTPSKRLEGLVPKMEEFHNQAEFLQVIWKVLYSTASSKDTGTLYAARNTINAKNVSKDPASNYYASSELVDKFTKAYIVNAAMKHFGIDSLDGTPKQNTYDGDIGDSKQMLEYIMSEATRVVHSFTDTDLPTIPESGYQSNDDIVCQKCGKKYKLISSLRNHEETSACKPETVTQIKKYVKGKRSTNKLDDNSDYIFNYSKTALTLGLLKLDHDDAIKLGDGERMLRLDSIMYLYYKRFKCTKYAYGMLETILQSKVLLSERLAHRLIWNRVVNHRGKSDSNHPNDLDIEHCNKTFKEEAHSYRGVFTQKTISRVSRSAMKTESILKNYDNTSKVIRPSGKHTFADVSRDIYALARQFTTRQVFATIPGRAHSAFRTIDANQLRDMDMEDFRDWLGRSMTKISKKHFYDYSL